MRNCRCITDKKSKVAQPSVRQAGLQGCGAGRLCGTPACIYNMSEMHTFAAQCCMQAFLGRTAADGKSGAEGLGQALQCFFSC